MKIDILDVKKLRELTGYSLADCKKSLNENNGNFDAAIKQLRAEYTSKYYSYSEDLRIERVFVSISECSSAIKFGFVKAQSDSVTLSNQFLELMSFALNDLSIDLCSTNTDEQNTENAKGKDSFKKMFDDLLVYWREPLIIEVISVYKAGKNEVIGKFLYNRSSDSIMNTVSAQKAAIISLKSSENLDNESISKLKDLADLIAMSVIANASANANVLDFEEPIINTGKLEWLKIPSSEDCSIKLAIQKAAEAFITEISVPYYRILRL